MPTTLPQQQLLLELLIMSGQIAVPREGEHTILWRTLDECRRSGWITEVEISPGIFRIDITRKGRGVAGGAS
jgi:hypothetical protein